VWQFYAAFPIAGNVLTAWSVLLLGSDALVSTTWLGVWLGTGLAGYVAARTIGASVSDAALGAALALTVPAAFHHMGSGSVDKLVAAALMALVAGFAASYALALALMPAHRTDYLAGAAAGQHFNSGPINLAPPIGARAFWTGLDRMEPRTVAVTAGSRPDPHHWMIYPLFGRDLQHRVIHVRTDVYYRDDRERLTEAGRAAARALWLADLERSGADLLVIYPPEPVELEWVRACPGRFERLVVGVRGRSALFAVHPPSAGGDAACDPDPVRREDEAGDGEDR